MDHKRARPCGSTIRKNTIKAPKIINSRYDAVVVGKVSPNASGRRLSAIGSSTMKAAPKKLPMIEPSPPMMTMNNNWKERSMLNAAGSHEPRCTKAQSAPATPTMKELTPNAVSLAYIGRMPITDAATSMSRIAIHSRPIDERVRFLASSANTVTKLRQNKYFLAGELMAQPNTSSALTETEPEAESLVNQLMRRNIQSVKNCAASVATAR